MRMVHYYLVLALIAPVALLATAWTGAAQAGGGLHFAFGLSTAIFCVALNTVVILFMIITGRVLRQAAQSRPMEPRFLKELNVYFAKKRAYPVAILAAFLAVVTAVLGYGRHIGVPTEVHMLIGTGTVFFELWAVLEGYRTLRGNQGLLDRVATELDRMDAAGIPVDESATEPTWRFALRGRWFVFAIAAWGPFLYWGLVAWHGDFSKLSRVFLVGTAIVSTVGFLNGLRTPRNVSPEYGEDDELGNA
ncbi:MAG: hypothetical protein ACI8QS_001074 [Planctomycetota bacterium]|jgi:hypothetical protein